LKNIETHTLCYHLILLLLPLSKGARISSYAMTKRKERKDDKPPKTLNRSKRPPHTHTHTNKKQSKLGCERMGEGECEI
jgi:hypothetical protein